MDPAELAELVSAVRRVEISLGSATLMPADEEWSSRNSYRLSCVASEAMAEGHMLSAADIAFRRPGTGLRPALAEQLIGRVLRHGVPRGHVFEEGDFV
jgi:sialic acid synthase SpsE